ncbi:DUF6248 family natural product biosynthesis protein [Kitasatospora sp. MBT63]|uniref:DUF6248 family natural product biosynthesis protein n=1 Tax=Kitasatospora sp. MBT63 TaxID=1444768 RepID=UPI00053B76A0|nr:DUF6248 family natural product biosynthesis protein [Kitasatospora sp. MBT63]
MNTTALTPRRRGPHLPLGSGRPVPRLRMVGAAFLAIREPIPSATPSPMNAEEGAWVRAHAWTRHLRRTDDSYPHGYFRWCECERGVCSNCVGGRHSTCATRNGPATGLGALTDGRGYVLALVVTTGNQRACSWICPCECQPQKHTGIAP